MKGETRRVEGRDGTDTMAKREIAGNTYLVIVATKESDNISHQILVYADKVKGEDHGFPSDTMGYTLRSTDYDQLIYAKVKHDESLAPVISKAVNQAVGKLTDTLEQTKSQEDAVLGALEANANIHEDDE